MKKFTGCCEKIKNIGPFKLLLLTLILYAIFLIWIIQNSTFIEDEGTHSLLSVFYIDLIKYAFSHPNFSGIYDYAISYLTYYPKLSVYYPPLTHFVILPFFLLFGKSYIVARFVPLIFSLGIVVLNFKFVKFLYDEKVALLSSITLMTLPAFIFSATEVYLNASIFFFFLLSVYLYLLAFKTKRNSSYILASISAALGFFTKSFFILPIYPILFLYLLFEDRGQIKKFILSSLLMLAIVSPYIIAMMKLNLFFIMFTATRGIDAYRTISSTLFTIDNWLHYAKVFNEHYFVFPFSLFLILSLFLFFAKKQNYWKLMLLWIAIIYVLFSIPPSKIFTYPMTVVFPFCAIVGKIVYDSYRIINKKIFILFALFLLFNLLHFSHTIPFRENYSREVAEFIKQNPNPVYLATENSYMYSSNIDFYLAADGLFVKVLRPCAIQKDINQTLYESGVKWVVWGNTDTNNSVVKEMMDKNLITLNKTIGKVNIYSYNFFNENPKENCNYVCLNEEKVCVKTKLD